MYFNLCIHWGNCVSNAFGICCAAFRICIDVAFVHVACWSVMLQTEGGRDVVLKASSLVWCFALLRNTQSLRQWAVQRRQNPEPELTYCRLERENNRKQMLARLERLVDKTIVSCACAPRMGEDEHHLYHVIPCFWHVYKLCTCQNGNITQKRRDIWF